MFCLKPEEPYVSLLLYNIYMFSTNVFHILKKARPMCHKLAYSLAKSLMSLF